MYLNQIERRLSGVVDEASTSTQ